MTESDPKKRKELQDVVTVAITNGFRGCPNTERGGKKRLCRVHFIKPEDFGSAFGLVLFVGGVLPSDCALGAGRFSWCCGAAELPDWKIPEG